MTASQTHRSKPVNLARYHRDPTVQAIDALFGTRRNGLAAELARAVVRMFRRAKELHLDGYVEEAEALHLLGGCRKTQRRRLDCLLELPKFFELRDGRLYLRKLWLSAEKRQADLVAWRRELDRDALKKRRKRGHDVPDAPIARRKDWLSDIADCIPEELLTPLQNVSPPAPEASPEGQRLGQIYSDPAPTPCDVPAKMPAAGEEVPLDWEETAAMSVAERRAWLAGDSDAEWEAKRRAPPKARPKKLLARDDAGTPLILLDMGFRPECVAYEKFTEDELLAGRAKVLSKFSDGPGLGGLLVHATRQLRTGGWRRPC